mgnify:FL=1
MVVQETRYVRKRGTAEIFAFAERLMSRGDMIFYNGEVPVPTDFVIPQAELDMLEAMKEARLGNMNLQKRSAVTTYVRKLGTIEVFASSPTLMARADMIPYAGVIPVPSDFVIPLEEIEMLVYQGKMKRPVEMPVESVPVLGLPIETVEAPVDLPQDNSEKIAKIVEIIKTLGPEDYRKDGLPNAMVIRKRLGGVVVTKAERDEAWEKIKAEEKDDNPGHTE